MARGRDKGAIFVGRSARGRDEGAIFVGRSERGRDKGAIFCGRSERGRDKGAIFVGKLARGRDGGVIFIGKAARGRDEKEWGAGCLFRSFVRRRIGEGSQIFYLLYLQRRNGEAKMVCDMARNENGGLLRMEGSGGIRSGGQRCEI